MKANEWLTEGSSQQNDETLYQLRLFITGASPNSARAVDNLKTFCDKYLPNKYQLEIIDVYQQPGIAEKEQIIALPLLLKKRLGTDKRLIGDMSNIDKLLKYFNIAP